MNSLRIGNGELVHHYSIERNHARKRMNQAALTQFFQLAKGVWDLSFEIIIFELDKNQVGEPTNPGTERSFQTILIDI